MSAHPVIPDVLEQHAAAASALWLQRDGAVRASNFRLAELERLDERIEAQIDGLRVAGQPGWEISSAALAGPDAGAFFAAGVLAIESGESVLLESIMQRESAAQACFGGLLAPSEDPWRGLLSALIWAAREPAVRAIDRLRNEIEPRLRAIALAALGGRRTDLGPNLVLPFADPSPLVRARTYRTAGQLGRADLVSCFAPGLADEDPECRFWCAWSGARMGAAEPLNILADIVWQNGPRAAQALDLLLRRLEVKQANAWLRELAGLPERRRSVIRATGVIGDPLYIPWLIERMNEPAAARLAGEAFAMITGVDLAYRDLDVRPPADFQSGPNDDPADENVALDEDDRLPWPDPAKVADWWTKNKARFNVGTPYFLGQPKASADWLGALSDAFQRQRRAAALELAIRQPNKAMFEVRARGRLQRQLLARARGEV
jgi:uncharacterized protein (TIGR02270 family)